MTKIGKVQLSYLEKITILIHTKNRPWFLLRLIKYCSEKLGPVGINVIILDCSDEENFSKISNDLNKANYLLNIRVLHHTQSSSFPYRMADALRLISTPYVLLAADDDLYFFDWLKSAVDLLDSDCSYGVVYGHTVRFELEHYEPYGKLIRFGFSEPNPPLRWLEGDTPLARLTELGRSDWATTGWYSLQRTELLLTTTTYASEYSLDGYHFERLLTFCQVALSKTKKLDNIYLARQIDNRKRALYSLKVEGKSIEALKDASTAILSDHGNIELKVARGMVNNAFAAEINALRKNDSRKYVRAIADRFPFLRELKLILSKQPSGYGQFHQDVRLAPLPEIGLDHPRVMDIMDVVS